MKKGLLLCLSAALLASAFTAAPTRAASSATSPVGASHITAAEGLRPAKQFDYKYDNYYKKWRLDRSTSSTFKSGRLSKIVQNMYDEENEIDCSVYTSYTRKGKTIKVVETGDYIGTQTALYTKGSKTKQFTKIQIKYYDEPWAYTYTLKYDGPRIKSYVMKDRDGTTRRKATYKYNKQKNLSEKTRIEYDMDGKEESREITQCTYYANGKLKSTISKEIYQKEVRNITTSTYDKKGRLKETEYTQNWTDPINTKTTTYSSYNSHGDALKYKIVYSNSAGEKRTDYYKVSIKYNSKGYITKRIEQIQKDGKWVDDYKTVIDKWVSYKDDFLPDLSGSLLAP